MILKRQFSCNTDRYGNCYSTTWDSWGRWAATALIIVFFISIFCLCACVSARRRRRFGRTPMYGTGFFAGPQPQQEQPYYPPQQNNPNTYYAYQEPVPTTAPPPPYGGYGSGLGYSREQQQTGIELESPAGIYAPPKVEPTNGMAGMPPRR